MNFFREKASAHHSQVFSVDAVLHQSHTGLQDALVFENHAFGRVFVLDGVVQLTERDNHIYHETLTHVPMLLHGSARRILIVGGGDGGVLREVLKHPVEDVRLVEIDREVVALSERFFPEVSDGAFHDARVRLIVEDAFSYVGRCDETFDVVIVDSTDPIGPGRRLYSSAFYAACRERLVSTGLLAAQSGATPYQAAQLADMCGLLRTAFGAATPFVAPVPSYPGGMLALALGAWSPKLLRLSPARLRQRFQALQGSVKYYAPEVHEGAFALAGAVALPDVRREAERLVQPALASAG
jgi:spermidine synthase